MGVQSQYPQAFQLQSGATLEHIILSNSKQFYKPGPTEKWRAAAMKIGNEINQAKGNSESEEAENLIGDDSNWCNKKWCWWSPPQDSIGVSFCSESTIHGLQYLGQRKRHMSERIFWLIAFLLSLAAAIYLIHGVWDRHRKIPVIVTFQAKEQDIDSIPFPAVTLCNMNKFPKSKVQELTRISRDPTHPKFNESRLQLTFVRSVCNAQHSFSKDFHFAYHRGVNTDQDGDNDTISEDNQDEMMDFLLGNTIPCDQLIRLCTFGETQQPCANLFRPVITDYGKCCTFNILPLPLLLKNPQNEGKENASLFDNPVLGTIRNWNESELKLWQKWDYDDGFVLPKTLERPYRQKRAGMPYGLSILVDPNVDDYYCPVSDSTGVRFILHTPLEMPHVMEFASVADLQKEILIEVHPEMTNADDDIRDFEREKRQCYFGKEKKLRFFGPYTGDDGVRICNNDLDSYDHECIEQARVDLQETLKQTCGHCDALCEDIAYNYETTIVALQDSMKLWGDPDPENHPEIPKWANHKMSILHIFFGSETTVPKLRKRLYGNTDLIANTGGILGLCLGFSVLSGVEVIYFITLRAFWKHCRRRMVGRRVANKFSKFFKHKPEKVIHVNPNMIPVHPAYPSHGVKSQLYNNNLQFMSNMYNSSPYSRNVEFY
ncbi:unnamed protein product [Orchesella dallaii]|uniref:Pickpocket protein 28 n=1 Tax=Orchesella dallaii TaxID=48710 RepID=A0ABP1QSL7_9HEXA